MAIRCLTVLKQLLKVIGSVNTENLIAHLDILEPEPAEGSSL